MSPTRSRSLPLALLLLAGCPPEVSPDPGALSAAPATDTGDETDGDATGGTETPTTGAPEPTTGGSTAADEPDPSDSSAGGSGGGTGPSLGACPFDPPGLDVAVARTVQGLTTDLSTRPCGAAEDLAGMSVIAAGPDHLELARCADGACGGCDPDDVYTLDLTVPAPFPGLPPQLTPGACLRLAARWDDASGGDPAVCEVSSLALVRRAGGTDEPVPRYMLHRGAALPATDAVGEFSLTGALAGPGAVACPCDADCCLEPPGSRRVRFTAARDKWQVEVPPIDPGDVVPMFALAVPDDDDLFGTIALVDAHIPSACDAPARYEWILHVTP